MLFPFNKNYKFWNLISNCNKRESRGCIWSKSLASIFVALFNIISKVCSCSLPTYRGEIIYCSNKGYLIYKGISFYYFMRFIGSFTSKGPSSEFYRQETRDWGHMRLKMINREKTCIFNKLGNVTFETQPPPKEAHQILKRPLNKVSSINISDIPLLLIGESFSWAHCSQCQRSACTSLW